MKGLIVYDSYFGNTEKIAMHINEALKTKHKMKLIKVDKASIKDLKGVEILIVGSPTRAFNTTKAIVEFIKAIPKQGLDGVKVAAFDTRMDSNDVDSKILNKMVKIFGYAAKPIGKKLVEKGGELIVSPEGFFVGGNEGPLKEGENERAEKWLTELL